MIEFRQPTSNLMNSTSLPAAQPIFLLGEKELLRQLEVKLSRQNSKAESELRPNSS